MSSTESGEGLNLLGKAALMAGSLIFVDQSTGSHAIEHRHRISICRLRSCFVTTGDGRSDELELGAHHGSTGLIVAAALFGLPGAFLSGGDIGQRAAPVEILGRRKER